MAEQTPNQPADNATTTFTNMAPARTQSWVKPTLIGLGAIAIAIIGLGAPFLIGSVSQTKETGPEVTHTIGRSELLVTIVADGKLESSNNTEIKCRVKGGSTVLWVIEGGTKVKPGDVLLRLDSSTIEENISSKKITYQTAKATFAQSESAVAIAKINIDEYLKGLFQAELKTMKMDVAVAQANLTVAENTLLHTKKMFRKGFVSKLELQGAEFTIQQAKLDLDVKQTNLEVLNKFTKEKMLQDLKGILAAAEAKLLSDKAAMELEEARLKREQKQLDNCVIKAQKAGMVIFPSAARWREAPDVEEGATVREDQVVLIMPDLSQMQVKVGVHESKVDQLKVGMPAEIELQNETVTGKIKSVATVTRPSGWWTGNIVKYDTVVELSGDGLKPGMSAQVRIETARHKNALVVPVAAVVESAEGFQCWVEAGDSYEKRMLDLGVSNDQFILITSGLQEGDVVALNPRAHITEAQEEALKPFIPKSRRQKTRLASRSLPGKAKE